MSGIRELELRASREWVALDFETATRQRNSACALGVTLVSNGEVADTQRWLFRPPANRYDYWNVAVHGITPDQTAASPSFGEVWDDIADYLGDRLLVAHNAAFDMGVLRAEFDHAGIEAPTSNFTCTLKLGRRTWRGLQSYSLPRLCSQLGIAFTNHHDPTADATACAQIGLRVLADLEAEDLPAAANKLGVQLGMLSLNKTISGAARNVASSG